VAHQSRRRQQEITVGQRISLIVGTIGIVLLGTIGLCLGGFQCLIGVELGTLLSCFSIWSLAMLTRSFLRVQPEPKAGIQRTVLVGILKFPILIALIFFGTRLSSAGIGCFIASIALVYFSFIGFWAFSDV